MMAASTASPAANTTVAKESEKSIQNGAPLEAANESPDKRHRYPQVPHGQVSEDERHSRRPRGEHEHLDEELRDDAATTRAQRGPCRELLLARHGPGVDQDRDVRAGWDEQKADEEQDEPNRPATLPGLEVAGERVRVGHDAGFELQLCCESTVDGRRARASRARPGRLRAKRPARVGRRRGPALLYPGRKSSLASGVQTP